MVGENLAFLPLYSNHQSQSNDQPNDIVQQCDIIQDYMGYWATYRRLTDRLSIHAPPSHPKNPGSANDIAK